MGNKVKNLIGQRFGNWLVLYRFSPVGKKNVQWFCKCDCGTEKVVNTSGLVTNMTTRCMQCYGKSKRVDYTNQIYNNVLLIRRLDPKQNEKLSDMWLCRCHCGKEFSVSPSSLKKGRIKSCGCNKLKLDGKFLIEYTKKHRKELNQNWNPNLSQKDREFRRDLDAESRKWSYKIKEKYNFICKCCNQKDISLNSHHILNWSEYPNLRFDLNNGICLCRKCHILFHKKYGYYKNNLEQIKEFINDSSFDPSSW